MVGTDDNKDPPKVSSKRIVVKRIRMRASTRKGGTSKIRKNIAKESVETSVIARTKKNSQKASFGLPSFRFEDANNPINSVISSVTVLSNHSEPIKDEYFSFDQNTDVPDEELPSDTLMAIHSLVQSGQGLHIPITNNGSVQVILESQVYPIFDDNHVTNVNAELLELIRTNNIQRLYCHDMSNMAFMLTEDYVKAVWDSHNSCRNEKQPSSATAEKLGIPEEEIVSWFLAQLHYWTKFSIPESSLVERCETLRNDKTEDKEVGPRDIVRYLLNAQFLLRNPKQICANQNDSYFLWLPNWGIVLKSWNEARRKLLTLLAQRKEMSKSNVLQKNRHSQISTGFLLNELVSTEKIRLIERPFGTFVQLVKDC